MEARITCNSREPVIRALERSLGITQSCSGAPQFCCSVGETRILRDGRIQSPEEAPLILLAEIGLCDYPLEPEDEPTGSIYYQTAEHTGHTLLNLLGILSARQHLINPAINAKKAFYIAPALIKDLYAHPPESITDLLLALHGRDAEYSGIEISRSFVVFSGFKKAAACEGALHRQLADTINDYARRIGWVKPITKNVRNKKYAMRTWMNAMGMTGPEYEEIRSVVLSRLPGTSNKKKRGEKNHG